MAHPAWTDDLARGRAAFNRGEFFEAHEHWEEAWRTLQDPERTVVQGLIQIAAGLHHLQHGRRAPAGRLLTKGRDKIGAAAPASLADLPLVALAAEVASTLATLPALAAEELPDLSRLRL